MFSISGLLLHTSKFNLLTKFYINLIIIFSSLQAAAKPSQNFDVCQLRAKYGHINPSEKDSNLSPSRQILKMILLSLQKMSVDYIIKVQPVAEQILKDSAIKNNNSNEIVKFKTQIQEFQEKYVACKDMNDLFKLLVLYTETTDKYYTKEIETMKEEEKLILEVLKKYKVKELEVEFNKEFLNFMKNYAKKLEEDYDELEKEKLDENSVKWWEEVDEADSLDDKLEILFKYSYLL